jgi:hypothetical protein
MRPERLASVKVLSWIKFVGPAPISLALLCIALASASPANTAPPASTISGYDLASFTQELRLLRANLDAAGGSTDALRAYREALPKSWPVDVRGRHFEVPTAPLVSPLARAEKRPEVRRQELDQARAYLESLVEEVSSFSDEQLSTSNSARSKLDAILARPEYPHARQQSWYEKVRERINEFILNLLARIFRGVGSQKAFGYLLLSLAIAASAILIAYWVFRNWFRGARAAEIALGSAAVPARSWQEWVFAAREAAVGGDHRAAVHCAYWAGIARLQELDLLVTDRTKTPREYLRALTSSKPILAQEATVRHRALAQMTSRLERTWYGYQLATEADFRDSITELETLGCHLP